ncbi:MAG: hypothetical protein EAZ37_15880 [Burkholderiales bacterium]|nr:MAG: hypothetical protein EAZ37_15880 [Burkholderiales bacterium]
MKISRLFAQLATLSLFTSLAAPAWSQTPAAKREQFKKETASQIEAPLPPELLAIAERVQTGRIPCELGHNVGVLPDDKSPGYFTITNGTQRFRLIPVPTTTGAIRLEDKARGGVWLQLANKSMLLDEKNGKRLADECLSPSQKLVADAMKAAPPASILGSPAGTVPSAPVLPQAAPAEAPPAAVSTPVAAPAAPAPLNLTPPTVR